MFSSSTRVAKDFVEVPKCYGIVHLMRLSGEVERSCVLFGEHPPLPASQMGICCLSFSQTVWVEV